MHLILQAYLDILFSRRGPEIIPPSLALFALTLAADAALTVLVIATLGADPLLHVISYLISLIMLFSVLWLLLNTLQLDARFLQAATAILGADVFLTIVQLFVALGAGDLKHVTSVDEAPFVFTALGIIHLWGLAIVGFVVKRAGRLHLLAAIGVVFAIFVLTRGATDMLLG